MKKTFYRALSAFLVAAMLLGCTAFAAEISYDDTDGHWAEDSIARWTDYGIINGNGTSFDPDAPLTRAMMATVIARMLGLTEKSENPFADVDENAWYAPYVLACHKAGIMLGDGKNANPEAPVSREEAMVMLCRALGIKPHETPDLTEFEDADKVSDWAVPYVSALTEAGIVGGVSEGIVSPAGTMSRAATVTVIDRAVVQYITEPGEYELTDKDGIVLVASNNVTITGKTAGDVLVSPAADNGSISVKNAEIGGTLTVMADNTEINITDSKAEIDTQGEGVKVNEKTEEPEKPEEPTTPEKPEETIQVHSHRWGEHIFVDENTHKRICASNSSHVLTDEHSWDAGVQTAEGILYTCKLCKGTTVKQPEAPEAPEEPELMGKNGYDIAIDVTDNIFSVAPILPEGERAPLYSIMFFDKNGMMQFGCTSAFRTAISSSFSHSFTAEYVRISTQEDWSSEEVPVASWKLDKKITADVESFEIDTNGITLTVEAVPMSNASSFLFAGLDTDSYSYTMFCDNMSTYVKNGTSYYENDFITEDNTVKIFAQSIEESDTAYTVKTSKPASVAVTYGEGGNEGEDDDEDDIDQAPVGFEITNQFDLIYVDVKAPEVTSGIYSYKVEIFNGNELLLEAEADVSQPKANIDPRLLVNGDLTVKITSLGSDGELGSYSGTLTFEKTNKTVELEAKYDNGNFGIYLAEDYKGVAYPFFCTSTGDTVGIRLASQIFDVPGNYLGVYQDALEAIKPVLTTSGGYVKLVGWTLEEYTNTADKSTLKVTVNESAYTPVTVIIDPVDADYSALGLEVTNQGIYYVFTIKNPESTSKIFEYDVRFYNSANPDLYISNGLTPTSNKAYLDAENLSKFNPLFNTIDVISYDKNYNEIGKYTCSLNITVEKKNIEYTANYTKADGRLTVTLPEALTAFVHKNYKAALGENDVDLQYSLLENNDKLTFDKTAEPLCNIVASVESVGGYFQMSGWNSNSATIVDDVCKLDYVVYNGNYVKINVTNGSSTPDGDENELPIDPDSVSDLAVKNIRFDSMNGGYYLFWDTAVQENDRVRYGIYVKKNTDTEWTHLTNTRQNLVNMSDESLEGSYDQIKVVTQLDRVDKAETVAEGLTLTVTKATKPTAAEATFVAVPDVANAYRISVMGLTPNSFYVIVLKKTVDAGGYSSFGGNTDQNGNEIAGEGNMSASSSLTEIVTNGYYLVYDFSNVTLSQDKKTLTYTVTQYGDWTKCTPANQ